ncbi:unnamed protein product [Closterium sp. NIES-54]
MMEKFFSFISFYEQHQQGAPAQSNNSNNNNATPMSLDGSSYARGNQHQRPTFAPYEPHLGSVSFMPHLQPASGQEKTLDALQVQSQFAHVLKLQTTKPFDRKDFFTWSLEFELMMEGVQILGFFDGSLPYPTHGTQYDKQWYTYQSMMAYTILLRNIILNQQQNIRSYRGYGNSAELAYNHLKNLYQATDNVNQTLATIQHSAGAETTSAAAETTSAAAETTAAAAATSTPIAGPSTASAQIDDTSPTPVQQLNPTPREVHRSANFTASFYSKSDLYRRLPGHRASEDI